jgi:succinate dehydrogenase/fumarate reductase flavoprotein subunit
MAAEAGAVLSGMELCVSYSISPVWCSTRTLPYMAARYYDAAGAPLDIPPPMSGPGHLKGLADAFRAGPVFADVHDAPDPLKTILRRIQPATPPPFDRKGLDPFQDRYEVKLFGEGTIRGVGGLRVTDAHCQTTVRGLFAAGDAATRELVTGAISGGGAVNSAWALSSGLLAGQGGAALARRDGRRSGAKALATGGAGLRPTSGAKPIPDAEIIYLAGEQILSLDKALWRRRPALEASRDLLEDLWGEIAAHGHAEGLGQVAARETAAVTATARWCNAAALAREESRGMHMRADAPAAQASLARRLLVGGLEEVWTDYDTAPALATEAAA